MSFHKEWVISNTGILMVLSTEAITIFQNYIQDDEKKLEAGGILLGKRRRNHFEILHVTEPTEFDQRFRYHWNRSEKSHSEIAKKIWTDSRAEITYLGEWHTHPEAYPTPSSIDLEEWSLLTQKSTQKSGLSMIIVGIKDLWCGIAQENVVTQMNKVS